MLTSMLYEKYEIELENALLNPDINIITEVYPKHFSYFEVRY
jgi:UDP-N-acetylmuramyl pentapeptide synthase